MTDDYTKFRLKQALRELTAIDGVSGHEQAVVQHLRDQMGALAEVEIDPLGNLYATRRGGEGPHLMVEAHSDEIGALVAAIEPDGFMRFAPVGGVAEVTMAGRKVRVGGHRGVVGIRPGHLTPAAERRTLPDMGELYVDLGLDSAEAVQALGVRPGDQIVWVSELEETANPDRIVGKGVDNRIGCAIMLELLSWAKDIEIKGTLSVVVAVQEEVGLKGARVSTERLRPDCALVVDTVPCADTPDSRHARAFPVRLGGGPVFQASSGGSGSGFLMMDPVRRHLVRVAEDAGIPYQLATFPFGNTDAAGVYVAGGGVATGAATIPRRYSHSPVEMLDLNDAVATSHLCQEVIRRMDEFPRGILDRANKT
jgi:putative aminopeptidase FrvX